MARSRILVDRNIPYAEEALAPHASVRVLAAAEIDAAAVRDVDLLWVRSTVKVNAALLDGAAVRFVATATIGTDHLDGAYLAARGIPWASAPGSNAPSVALWWAAALCTVAERRRLCLGDLRVGIVGVGHVGRRIEAFAAALGCPVLRCDPPRDRAEGQGGFVSLDELCRQSDVVTLHVPLAAGGADPTFHLFDAARLAGLPRGALLVNACRGAVVDGAAFPAARAARDLVALFDVYEGEPDLPPALVEGAALATAHVAGHSLDGKAAGTQMIYDATCAFLGVRPSWTARRSLPPLPITALTADVRGLTDEAALLTVLRRFYRIEDDDAALRRIAALPDGERGRAFQRFRATYPVRREPIGLRLALLPARPRVAAALATLGVETAER